MATINCQKKTRAPNFTVSEKELIIALAKYKTIIENKKTDGPSMEEKTETWKEIESQFNKISPNLVYRSWESIKKFYENQKKELKKRVAEVRKESYKTGGAPHTEKSIDPSDEPLLSILNEKTVFGLVNEFDDDNITFINNPTEDKSVTGNSAKGNTAIYTNDIIDDYIFNNHDLNYDQIEYENTEKDSEKENVNNKDSNEDSNKNKRIEIIFNDMSQSQDKAKIFEKKDAMKKFKPNNIRNPINESLKRKFEGDSTKGISKESNKEFNTARRRPNQTFNTLTASSLHEKYEKLVDKKLVNADFERQEITLRIDTLRREHPLKMELLQLDIELKKRQLEATKKFQSQTMLLKCSYYWS